jgi:hypothetical protein
MRDPIRIAELEFEEGVCPLDTKRPENCWDDKRSEHLNHKYQRLKKKTKENSIQERILRNNP